MSLVWILKHVADVFVGTLAWDDESVESARYLEGDATLVFFDEPCSIEVNS